MCVKFLLYQFIISGSYNLICKLISFLCQQKDPKSGNKSLEKCPGPNPNTTEKEGDKAGKKCSVGQNQVCNLASLEPMVRLIHAYDILLVTETYPHTHRRYFNVPGAEGEFFTIGVNIYAQITNYFFLERYGGQF